MDVFNECYRICECINNDDLPSDDIKYLDAFKDNLRFLRDNFDKLDMQDNVMRITHLKDHIQFLTEQKITDKESRNRKKLLQIYFLIKTKLF